MFNEDYKKLKFNSVSDLFKIVNQLTLHFRYSDPVKYLPDYTVTLEKKILSIKV